MIIAITSSSVPNSPKLAGQYKPVNFQLCRLIQRCPRITYKPILLDNVGNRKIGCALKVRLILPPWAGQLNDFSTLFEAFIIKFCKHLPVHHVCQLMNISDYRVWKLLNIYVDKARPSEDLSGIEPFGMDETATA